MNFRWHNNGNEVSSRRNPALARTSIVLFSISRKNWPEGLERRAADFIVSHSIR
jgi:hypothetical protein